MRHNAERHSCYGLLTLTVAETKTEADKKMGSIGLCEVIHTAQRLRTTQIPVGICILVIGLSHC